MIGGRRAITSLGDELMAVPIETLHSAQNAPKCIRIGEYRECNRIGGARAYAVACGDRCQLGPCGTENDSRGILQRARGWAGIRPKHPIVGCIRPKNPEIGEIEHISDQTLIRDRNNVCRGVAANENRISFRW